MRLPNNEIILDLLDDNHCYMEMKEITGRPIDTCFTMHFLKLLISHFLKRLISHFSLHRMHHNVYGILLPLFK